MPKNVLATSAKSRTSHRVLTDDDDARGDANGTTIAAATRDALAAFERALLARGAEQTTRRYLAACRILAESRGEAPLHETDSREAQRVLSLLRSRDIAPRTLATTLSAWKSWFRLLARTDSRFRPDAFDTVRVPRPPKRLPNSLTETEMTQLLEFSSSEAGTSQFDEHAIRDQAMFELLYGCGMRISELVGLDIGDLDLESAEVRVFGKGRKERVLPLGGKARAALEAWVAARPQWVPADAPEKALFIGARGGRIAATIVRKTLAARAVEANLASHVHPHRLRHSFASHVLQSSRDLRAVQELMGHASIASTQVYTHLDFQHLARVYDDAHPRATKRKKG